MTLYMLLMLTNCLSLSLLLFTPGCSKQPDDTEVQATTSIAPTPAQESSTHTFNLNIENTSGKTLYTCCFSYAKHTKNALWRWHKSNIIKLDDDENKTIATSVYNDPEDIEHTFGVLGIFNTQKEAADATYELLPDKQKLDLDLLYKLIGKKITLTIEKYGTKQSFYNNSITDANTATTTTNDSFFNVLNKTEKPIIICFFSYEDRNTDPTEPAYAGGIDVGTWRYYKSAPMAIAPDATQKIDLPAPREQDTEIEVSAPCYLGIFGAKEQKEADACTLETMPQHKKLCLDAIANLQKQTVEINIEHYGIKNNIIEFVVKPTQRINLKTIHFQSKEKP